MRALVVAPQPFFSPRGTPFSVYYRTEALAQLGVEVDLLTYGEGQDVDIPGVRIHRIPRFRFLGPVPVGPSWLKAWLDVFVAGRAIGLLLRNRYDFVHAHEESVFFLRYLKRVFGLKLVYDMHSSLPQQLRNFEYTDSRLLIRAFAALEDRCLAGAEAVITICPELAEYALPRIGDPSRHFLIENSLFEGVRLKGNGAAATAEPQASLEGLPAERPIVAYAGTFERYQGIDVLVHAFAEVRRRRQDAFLLLIGGLPEQVAHYRTLAEGLGLARDSLITGRVDQATVRRHLARAAVLTSPRTEGTNTPLKIYEQLASGIPLVATRILSHTQVLDDAVCFLCDPTPPGLACGILAALDDGARRERVVAGAKALYEERYSRRAYMEKMAALVESLR